MIQESARHNQQLLINGQQTPLREFAGRAELVDS